MTRPEITDAAVPTDEDFRAIGFTKEAGNWPRDELAVKMIAAFNGVAADDLPSLAWRYFPNQQTAEAWKRVADVALAAGRAEAVAAGWQTMDTAPMDGRHILLRVPENDGFIFAVEGGFAEGVWHSVYFSNVEPLGWMPLPGSALVSAPAAEAEPAGYQQRHREKSGEMSAWYPSDKQAFDAIKAEPISPDLEARPVYAAPSASQEALREAARDLIHSRSSQFRARNNRMVGIQDEHGEKCWIVPFDEMLALEVALDAALAQSAPVKAGG